MYEPRPLHPNLARLAARYDHIMEQFGAGQIDADEAQRELARLHARDDQGVTWLIHPADGRWYRMATVSGELLQAEPPEFGVATPTAADVSNGPGATHDQGRVISFEVDDTAMAPSESLVGATRRPSQLRSEGTDVPDRAGLPAAAYGAFAVAALLIVLVIVLVVR